jgi:hypothetical protein
VLGPYSFSLTEDEARAAKARFALRSGLGSRFERDYIAPLALFVLLLVFVAILALSGLIARRLAEAMLLIGAIFFLATRFLAHWRLRGADRLAKRLVDRIAASGERQMSVDENGLRFAGATTDEAARYLFLDVAQAEDAGGVIYLWLSASENAPIVIPTRIFPDAAEAGRFLAFARARIGKR